MTMIHHCQDEKWPNQSTLVQAERHGEAVMVADQVEIRPDLVPRWLSIEVRRLLHYRQLLSVYETAT